MVVDIGPPTDWVKINVQKTKDCYEIYALVCGLLREEVNLDIVVSPILGRLYMMSVGYNFNIMYVVSLPSRIDPYQTSVVVTLHGAKRWHPLENGDVEYTCDI
ncbi:hypothetical protein EJD97_012151, partial [Solanum chilense]